MGHYDFMYENLTKNDVLKDKEREQIHSKGLEESILRLQEDIELVKHEKTKNVIQREIDDVNRRNERTKERILAWDRILERIERGERVSYSERPRII